ncbi:MAG: FecR domain-containing protein [Bacteroidota bacterium]
MDSKKLEKLIVKYLSHSITQSEWEELNSWIEKSKNTEIFTEYLKINYAIDDIMSEFNTKRTKESVLKKIKEDKSSLRRLQVFKVLKYAAVILFFLGIGYFYKDDFFNRQGQDLVFPSENDITLELENGSMKIISEDGTTEIRNKQGHVVGTQKGNRLFYNNTEDKTQVLEYNQLTVPYGKRFELELSDGTIAHLNAGSSLKYPIHFLERKERKVFLVGEAFLEVAKDIERPFLVNANDLDVRVLGTQFNVSAYPEDKTTDVVLVEGSVALSSKQMREESILLEPGFKGSLNKEGKSITTKPVITKIYTSWMKGELVFRDVTFENILKKLERHYNVKITNRNLEFSEKRFNANFGDEPIEKVLEYFKQTYGIGYTISEVEIIIE